MKCLMTLMTLSTSLALLLLTGPTLAQNDERAASIADEPVLELFTGQDQFVAEVTEELFIALAVQADGSIAGYLCDGEEIGAWFDGEVIGKQALVAAGENIRIDLTFNDRGAEGTVALAGAEPVAFSPEPAVSGSGLQRLETPLEDGGMAVSGWVTLNDGRQRGCVCFPPFTGPCCEMRTN